MHDRQAWKFRDEMENYGTVVKFHGLLGVSRSDWVFRTFDDEVV